MQSSPLLQINRLSKAFAVPVLKEVEFNVAAGEVVALTGENGAGKSTLSKIIAGLMLPDSGEMCVEGRPYAPASRAQAERLGVRMVLQELGLIGTLSVAENLVLGRMPARAGLVRRAEMQRIARRQLGEVGLSDIEPDQQVSELGIGQQQLVEIARGLMDEARLLILDEPTAMLTARETEHLFEQIAQLKARGVGVIYISHRLDELARIADRIVVLRDGQLVCDRPTAELEHDDIVRAMVGHEPAKNTQHARRAAGKSLLQLEGLSRKPWVRDVNLEVHAGEIVGLAGLVGSGRTELLRLIFGADRQESGAIHIEGNVQPVQINSPVDALTHGIGLLTEDRKTQGLLLSQSLAANLTLADLAKISRRGWVDLKRERSAVDLWMQRLRIRARNAGQCVEELSGGNQQKILLARWLYRDCRILLLDEPTRGIDVGARADIYAELNALAEAGKALLMVSSDLRELMALCDRIAVMSAGALVQVFMRGQWSEESLLGAAFSRYGGSSAGASH